MAEAKFVIEGKDYPIPGIETFNLDEAMVLYHYSHLTLDQVLDLDGMSPGLLAALLHVALVRADPDSKFKGVEKVVRKSNLFELIEKMEDDSEDDEEEEGTGGVVAPLAPQPEPPAQPGTEPAPEPTGDDGSDDGNTLPAASDLPRIGSQESAMG